MDVILLSTLPLLFNVPPAAGTFTNASCQGSGFSTTIGGTTFNEGNPSGTAMITAGAANGCDSTVNVTLTFNAPPAAGIFTNTSCQGSGFSTTIGGTTYNEGNPSGTAMITAGAANGCDSTRKCHANF